MMVTRTWSCDVIHEDNFGGISLIGEMIIHAA